MPESKVYEVVIKGIPTSIRNVGELNAAIKKVNTEFKNSDFGSTKFKSLQKNLGQLKGIQQDIIKTTKQQTQEFQNTGVASNSIRGLALESKRLKNILEVLDPNTPEFVQYRGELAKVENQQKKLRDSSRQLKRDLEEATVDPTSLRGLELQYTRLRARIKQLSAEERKGKVGQQLMKDAAGARAEINRLNQDLNDFGANIGNYQSAFENLAGIFGGGFAGSIASGFAAGGAFAFIDAGIEGLGEVQRYVDDTVDRFRTLKREVNQLTGATGSELDQFVVRIKTIADVFGKDYNEVLRAANAESKQTGISISKSLDAIEERFLEGADASGNLLDSVSEYSAFIKEAELNTNQFTAILVNSERQGIFSDKGIDAVKEGVLRIRELPKATEEAINALGITSSELDRIIAEEGIGGAIAEISKRINGLKDDSPLVGQALADIFGGAGEDAGVAYIKSLQNINDETNSLIDTSNTYVEAQIRQLDTVNRLNEAQLKLANVFGDGNTELSSLSNLVKAELTLALVEILELFSQLATDAIDVIEAISGIKIEGEGATKVVELLAKIIKSVLVGNLDIAAKGFRVLYGFVNEFVISLDAALKAIGRFDLNALTEQFKGFFNRVGVRSGLVSEQVEENVSVFERLRNANSDLTDELGKYNQESEKTVRVSGKQTDALENLKKKQEELRKSIIDAVDDRDAERVANLREEYKKVSDEIERFDSALDFTDKKLVEFTEGSLAFFEAEISRINKELKNADPDAYAELSQELIKNENDAKKLREELERIKEAFQAVNEVDETPVFDLSTAAPTVAPSDNNQPDGGFEEDLLKRRLDKQKEFLQLSKLEQLQVERDILNEKIFNSQLEFEERLRFADELAAKELEIIKATEAERVAARRESYEQIGGVLDGVQQGIEAISQIGDIVSTRQSNKLEERYQRELQLAGENEEAKKAAEERFEREKRKLDERAFKRNKRIAIAQALINGAIAATQALANTVLPFPLSLTALIPVAITTALQVATISSQRFQGEKGLYLTQEEVIGFASSDNMEQGGTVRIGGFAKGRRHSQGGIKTSFHGVPVEIEDGEFVDVLEDGGIAVINRKSSSKFANEFRSMAGKKFKGKRAIYSQMNQSEGGIAFQDGGVVSAITPNLSAIGSESLRRQGLQVRVTVDATARISEEDMDKVAGAVELGSLNGSMLGTKEGAKQGIESDKLAIDNIDGNEIIDI